MAYTVEQIRNIALCGHSGAGKTSLSEAMLYNMKLVNRMGRIQDGTTVSDYDKAEIERQISIKVSLLNGNWGSAHLNILDTPGYTDFIAEAKAALRVADAAVVVVDAVAGIEIGTERVWHFAAEYRLPRVLFVNKMDRADANPEKILEVARRRFGRQVVQLQLPVEPGEGFHQLVDLVDMKLLVYGNGKVEAREIPAALQENAQRLHEQLVEAVAETDEELMEKYFGEGELSPDDLKAGLRKAAVRQMLFPVCFGAACNNIGVDWLMDSVVSYMPTPLEAPGSVYRDDKGEQVVLEVSENVPLVALVFKILAEQHVGELSLLRLYAGRLKPGDEVFNVSRNSTERIGQIFALNGHQRTEVEGAIAGDIVALVKLKGTHTGDTLCGKGRSVRLPGIEFPEPLICVAISSGEKGNEERMATGMAQIHEEDPSFIFRFDGEIRQALLFAQGELHLDVIIQRLKDRYGVAVTTESPRIPYRETIRSNAEGHYRHKKQTGGRGQFGEVFLKIAPKGRGEGFEFSSEVVGGNIPSNFIPAVEKGVIETLNEGPLAGYKVVDVKVTVTDGKHHPVDSDEVSFKIAGSMAFKDAFLKARPVLLEPIYRLRIAVPEECMGDVMGDLSARRGRINGMDTDGHFQIIHAEVPLAELERYATALRSMTQGKGVHTQRFDRYEEIPGELMAKIVEAAKKQRAENN